MVFSSLGPYSNPIREGVPTLTEASRREAPKGRICGNSVHRHVFRLHLEPQYGNTGLFQRAILPCDVLVIVDGLESLSQFSKRCLDLPELYRKLRCFVSPVSSADVAVSAVIEAQVASCEPVFIEVDTIHPSHVHEPHAACAAEPLFQGFPNRFHSVSCLLFCAGLHWCGA